MKTTMQYIMIISLLVLSGTMQAGAVDYKNHYKGKCTRNNVQGTEYRIQTVGAPMTPSATFQSTSAYSGKWNQDAQQSMLNSDGSVNTDAYMGNTSSAKVGPRRIDAIGNPEEDEDDPGNVPIGDGLLIMLLMAAAYAGFVMRARRLKA